MLSNLLRRAEGPPMTHTMTTLLTVLLVLILVTFILVAVLLILRHRRRARKASVATLPVYVEKRASTSSNHSHHRRLTVRPSQSIHIYREKEISVEESSRPSSPAESLPEIRITFPEEVDDSGKRQSGRVVVVHVGDTGVGLEPLSERKLPAYRNAERFESLDLERMGGLDEKKGARKEAWD